MHPHSLSQPARTASATTPRSSSGRHSTETDALKPPRSPRMSPRVHVLPAATPISYSSAATKLTGSRESMSCKQGALTDSSADATACRRTSESSNSITRGTHIPRVCVPMNSAVSVARRRMPPLTGVAQTPMTRGHPRCRSRPSTTLSKTWPSLSRVTPRSLPRLPAHPRQVSSNARCRRSSLSKAKRRHRSSVLRHIDGASYAAGASDCIARLSPANVDAYIAEGMNEPFAEGTQLPTSQASRLHVETLSVALMRSSAYNHSFAASSNGSMTLPKAPRLPLGTATALPGIAATPIISAVTPENGRDAAQRRYTPCRVHPAHRHVSHIGLTPLPQASSGIAPTSSPREIPPASAMVLPLCTDAQLRSLFSTLFVRAGDATWSCHRHILPFLAARQHCIMPVAPSQVAAFVGFADLSDEGVHAKEHLSAASDSDGEQAFSSGRSTTTAMSRFASRLCYWFVYVGALGCNEEMHWGNLLMPLGRRSSPSRRSPLRGAHNSDSAAAARAPLGRGNSPSLRSGTPEKQRCDCSLSRSCSDLSDVSARTPCVGTVTKGREQHELPRPLADGDDVDDESCPKSTVLWHTDPLDYSTSDVATASTLASVEFRTVVEAPPLVQEVAFVRGYKALHALLENREAQLAHMQAGSMAAALRTLCAAAGTSNGASTEFRLSQDCPAATLQPGIRTVYRRVRFYLRLYAFVRELCVCLREHEIRPWQRESYAVESIVSSRLCMTASLSSCDAVLARTAKGPAVSETSTGLIGGWRQLRDTLARGTLRAALRATPARVSAGSLETLLILRNDAATQVVRRAAETISSIVTAEGSPRASNAVGASAYTSASATSARVPPQLLLIFPLPRWSSSAPPRTALRKEVTAFDLVASCALGFALAFGVLSSCLFILAARVVSAPWRTAPLEPRANGGPAQHLHALRCSWTYNLVWQCWSLLLLLACTARVAHYAGEAVASVEVTHTLASAQSVALTSASDGWLQAAWALQSDSSVAAHAVQRCIERLRSLEKAVNGIAAAPLGLRRVLACSMPSRYWLSAFIGAVITCTIKTALHPGPYAELAAVVMMACGVSAAHVCGTRQHRRRALAWWLYCQANTAESFADDILRVAGDQCTEGLSAGVDVDEYGGPAARGSLPANRVAARTLYTISLPMLEELAKVACLVEWSERCLLPKHQSTGGTGPATISALPVQWFWEQLCGRAAPTFTKGVSSAAVVENTMRACRRALEAEQGQRGSAPLAVAEAVAYVLPWTLDYDAATPPPTGALEGCCDDQASEVLAPFAGAAAGAALAALIFQGDGEKDGPIALDVNLRRLPYLSHAQGRLVVCAAFVFASLKVAPRAVLTSLACHRAPLLTCIGEGTFALLVRLVHSQLHVAPSLRCRNPSKGTATARWRQAATRTRDALRLLQDCTLAAQQDNVRDAPVGRAYGALLPSLLHALFR
ncbi:hypothetical protein JIQ42_06193 [Leishmania sp. Namibia]|uniref:hypothetical protein n=1 Tax=Leishmania sp. Namibia TaxID=2802991 RepID=UPI001B50C3D9|nr:hypothetical protein JIQ42_06193 [Leishmania sp. Namibia]